jgi:hypothetical protein
MESFPPPSLVLPILIHRRLGLPLCRAVLRSYRSLRPAVRFRDTTTAYRFRTHVYNPAPTEPERTAMV